jgi:hypothetical protein
MNAASGIPEKHASGDAGFTLVETLATLLLTSVIVATLSTLTGQWLGAWNRGAPLLERMESMAVAFDRIARDAGAAIPMMSAGTSRGATFIGGADWVMFVHPSIDPGAPGGLEVVRLSASRDGRLMRARAAFDPDAPFERTNTGETVAVSREPFTLAFSYLDDEGKWASSWSAQKPPSALRVRFGAARGSGLADVVASFPIRAGAPAVCGRANAWAVCEALAAGQVVQGQAVAGQGEDAEAARQARARAGTAQ